MASTTGTALALGLACRHSTLGSKLHGMCTILHVSREVRQAVLGSCSGSGNSKLEVIMDTRGEYLSVYTTAEKLQILHQVSRQVQWLADYGALVSSMHLASDRDLDGAEAVMGVAVRPPVQLQRLKLNVERPSKVLEQLDVRHLTSLEVILRSRDASVLFARALGSLPRLKQLRLRDVSMPKSRHDTFSPDLSFLTGIMLLDLNGPAATSSSLLLHLPVSVVQLQLTNYDGSTPLSYLTRLQRLEYEWSSDGKFPSSTSLMASVYALASLQHLALDYGFCSHRQVLAHAPVWGTLSALRSLSIDVRGSYEYFEAAPTPIMCSIAAATFVTRLTLEFYGEFPGDITEWVAPLKQLQHLGIFQYASPEPQTFQSFGGLASQLTCLEWRNVQLSPLAKTQLMTASRLQELNMDSQQFGDSDLAVIGHHMTNIRVLNMSNVSVAAVKVALGEGCFPRLRRLELGGAPECHSGSEQDLHHICSSIEVLRPGLDVACTGWLGPQE